MVWGHAHFNTFLFVTASTALRASSRCPASFPKLPVPPDDSSHLPYPFDKRFPECYMLRKNWGGMDFVCVFDQEYIRKRRKQCGDDDPPWSVLAGLWCKIASQSRQEITDVTDATASTSLGVLPEGHDTGGKRSNWADGGYVPVQYLVGTTIPWVKQCREGATTGRVGEVRCQNVIVTLLRRYIKPMGLDLPVHQT